MAHKNGAETLTNFKRDTPRFLKRLRKTKRPVVLTIDGKPELIVQDAASYRKLLEKIERLETVAALREAQEDIAAGRVLPAEDVLAELARKYNLKSARDT